MWRSPEDSNKGFQATEQIPKGQYSLGLVSLQKLFLLLSFLWVLLSKKSLGVSRQNILFSCEERCSSSISRAIRWTWGFWQIFWQIRVLQRLHTLRRMGIFWRKFRRWLIAHVCSEQNMSKSKWIDRGRCWKGQLIWWIERSSLEVFCLNC